MATIVREDWEDEPGLSWEENCLLNQPLPNDVPRWQAERLWDEYQYVIGRLLVRMGADNALLESIARVALVGSVDGFWARLALIPKLRNSAIYALKTHEFSDVVYRLAGECTLMELSAAAGYRTFCLPDLIRGLLKTGKMEERSVQRMMDTFEFLNTMCQHPYDDERVLAQLNRTNGLHSRYKVASAHNERARDLFKYIALNMFYVGPRMRPDLTPQERHAICGLTILVAGRMGHVIQGSVKQLESFIDAYEAKNMFDRDEMSTLRRRAIDIAQASKAALDHIPTICPARIHAFVPYRVKRILEIG